MALRSSEANYVLRERLSAWPSKIIYGLENLAHVRNFGRIFSQPLVANHPCRIDHKNGAIGYVPDISYLGTQDPVRRNHFAIRVAQEWEIQAQLLGESFVAELAVDCYTQNFSTMAAKEVYLVPEPGQFSSSTRLLVTCEVQDVEC